MNTNVVQADDSVEEESAQPPPQPKSNASLASEAIEVSFEDIVTRYEDIKTDSRQQNKSRTKRSTTEPSTSVRVEKVTSKPASIVGVVQAWKNVSFMDVVTRYEVMKIDTIQGKGHADLSAPPDFAGLPLSSPAAGHSSTQFLQAVNPH